MLSMTPCIAFGLSSPSHMFFGKFPERDHQEKEWSSKSPRAKKAGSLLNSHGVCGMAFAINADGEFFQNEFRLQASSHNQCGWTCGANKSDIPHNDYRATAKWKETIKNHKDNSPTDHLITTVPGINGYSFACDTLHILELGVESHVVAGKLHVRPGGEGGASRQHSRSKAQGTLQKGYWA